MAKRRTWTEAEIVEAGAGKLTDSEVGAALNLTRERVRQLRQQFGIAANYERANERIRQSMVARQAEEARGRDQKIRSLWESTKNPRRIAKKLKLAPATVIASLRRLRIEVPNLRRKHDWASIDWSQTTTEIARGLGVHPNYVSRMRTATEATGRAVYRANPTSHMARAAARAEKLASEVDWSLSNAALANVLKVTEGGVSRIRLELRRRGFVVPRAPRR